MNKIVYCFFTIDGHGLPIAHKLQLEGEKVYVGFINSYDTIKVKHDEDAEGKKRRLSFYDNMFENKLDADELLKKLLSVPEEKRDNYRIICDFNFLHSYANPLRKAGFKGLLPHKQDEELEKDREAAKKLVQKKFKNVKVGDYYKFKDIEKGIQFLSKNTDTLFVLKGFNEGAPTIVPKTNDVSINHIDIIDALEDNKKDYTKDGYIFEEKIPDIVEFTPEAISFNGKLLSLNVNIEAKYLGPADSGSQVGCAFDLICWLPKDHKIYDTFLKPKEDMMLRKNELVYWDMSAYWSDSYNSFIFGEFCENRMGFNAAFTELSTFLSTKSFYDKIWAEADLFDKSVMPFGASVRLFNLEGDKKNPGLKRENELIISNLKNKNVWAWDIKKDENGKLRTCGYDKNLAIITGQGNTPEEAIKDVFKNIKYYYNKYAYYRSLDDFLSLNYDTSILKRYYKLKKLGIL